MNQTKQLLHMGSIGLEFMEVAGRAFKGFSSSGQQLRTLVIPVVVNYAFACEVNLKMILLYLGKKVRGHKLRSLYDLLPLEIKEEIKREAKIGSMNFDTELARISDACVDW
jgi:hypothetical protein